MTRKILHPILPTGDNITASLKRKIFKTLGYENQTQYIRETGVAKNQLIDTIVEQYNVKVAVLNVANRKKKKTLSRSKLYRVVVNLSKQLGVDANYYKKIYKTSTSLYWIKELDVLKSSILQQYRVKQSKYSKRSNLGILLYSTVDETYRKGDLKAKTYIHTIPRRLQLYISKTNIQSIKNQLKTVVDAHLKKTLGDGTMYRLHVEDKLGKHISTAILKSSHATIERMMKDHIVPKSSHYEFEFLISRITFSAINSTKMCGYTRSIGLACKRWHVVNPDNALTCCVYHSVVVCRNWKKYPTMLVNGDVEAGTRRKNSARDLKAEINKLRKRTNLPPLNEGGDHETIQCIC